MVYFSPGIRTLEPACDRLAVSPFRITLTSRRSSLAQAMEWTLTGPMSTRRRCPSGSAASMNSTALRGRSSVPRFSDTAIRLPDGDRAASVDFTGLKNSASG